MDGHWSTVTPVARSVEICAAVGLGVVDLMPTADTLPTPSKTKKNGPRANGKPRIVATYDYRDEAGNVLFQAVRYLPKDFKQRRPKPGGGWDWSVKGVRVVPYGPAGTPDRANAAGCCR